MIHDGHVHTPFCPHGTKDSLHKYCETAISYKLKGITFTEHAPLPQPFFDTTPNQDSGMKQEDLEPYLQEVSALKKEYKGHLDILVGLEVDYIEGFEKETTVFLDEWGHRLDDSILSVHFLNLNSEYVCLDYSPDAFEHASTLLGSIDSVYHLYYQTVLKSVHSNLGQYKPKRIGHITLARKFHRKFPASHLFMDDLVTLLSEIKKRGYELDYNGAGTMKPLCKEPYPFYEVIQVASNLKIPLVYGSDAHQASSLMNGFNELAPLATLVKPREARK